MVCSQVKEKTSDGWWFVRIGDKEGWAPSTYIESKAMEDIPEVDQHPPPHPTCSLIKKIIRINYLLFYVPF